MHLLDPPARLGHGADRLGSGPRLGQVEGVDLVIAGNEATDGTGGAVPAIIAEYLGPPQLTHLRKVSIEGGRSSASARPTMACSLSRHRCPRSSASTRRSTSRASCPSRASWPPRKEVATLTLAEIGVGADEVGLDNAGSTVVSST